MTSEAGGHVSLLQRFKTVGHVQLRELKGGEALQDARVPLSNDMSGLLHVIELLGNVSSFSGAGPTMWWQ